MAHFRDLHLTTQAAVVGAAIYLVYYVFGSLAIWSRRRALQREKGTLPAPWPDRQGERILGLFAFRDNLKSLKNHTLLAEATDLFFKSGVNTIQILVLGRHLHVTIEPENLKTIQAIDAKKWSLPNRRKTRFHPLLGEGIFTTDGQQWQHSREMLRPNFVRSQVGDLETFETHVSHLIAAIPANTTVDLSELFFRLTIDSATEFLFGESTESLTRNSAEGFAEAFGRSQEFIANATRYGFLSRFLPTRKQFVKDAKFVHDFVDYFVEKGLAKRAELINTEKSDNAAGRYVFIDELVRQTSDRIRIRSELLNILLAGRDTTASLLTNVWSTLSKRPDVWARLQAEVAQLGGERPTFEQLKDFKYLKAVLNESLRVHPIVPLNSRQATEDTTLPVGGGPDGRAPIFIPKGEVVAWNLYAMHRRRDYYGQDADEFNPDRWLDNAETGKKGLRPGWEFLPFNGGPRICIGQQFALTEASYTTVRLCQTFSGIEARDHNPWTESLSLTCVNLHGAKVSLTPRET